MFHEIALTSQVKVRDRVIALGNLGDDLTGGGIMDSAWSIQ